MGEEEFMDMMLYFDILDQEQEEEEEESEKIVSVC